MSLDVDVEVKGLRELEARLLELSALGGERALRRVLRKVAEPLRARAAENARAIGRGTDKRPGSSGALSAAMRVVTTKPEKADQVARVVVAPRFRERTAVFVHNAFYDRSRKAIFYGHLVEFGHRVGTRKGRLRRESRALTERGLERYQRLRSAGMLRGREGSGEVQARPWFRPAVQATRAGFVDTFVGELRDAIRRLERRKGRKQAQPDSLVP